MKPRSVEQIVGGQGQEFGAILGKDQRFEQAARFFEPLAGGSAAISSASSASNKRPGQRPAVVERRFEPAAIARAGCGRSRRSPHPPSDCRAAPRRGRRARRRYIGRRRGYSRARPASVRGPSWRRSMSSRVTPLSILRSSWLGRSNASSAAATMPGMGDPGAVMAVRRPRAACRRGPWRRRPRWPPRRP